MAKVGYARVRSVGQFLEIQREKLFEEKCSGTTDARPQLKQCLGYVREGDQLIVTRIDRPALTEDQILELREKLKQGTLIKDLMAHYSLSKATIYRYLSETEG